MPSTFADWLDDRTGYRAIVHEALEEPIPGGARWRYVFGSALSTTFLIQVATGLLLMLSYSPSSSTAWGSVFYISNSMTLGCTANSAIPVAAVRLRSWMRQGVMRKRSSSSCLARPQSL